METKPTEAAQPGVLQPALRRELKQFEKISQGMVGEYTKSRESWLGKLDEHEKSINTMLMGLAGGLLAFTADYVKDLAAPVPVSVQALAGAAIVGAALSLTLGALRAWLRTVVYRFELARLNVELSQKFVAHLQKFEPALAALDEANVRKLLNKLEGQSEDAELEALRAYYSEHPHVLVRQLNALEQRIVALKEQHRHQRRIDLMNRLEPLQIILFLTGALCLAGLVFGKLVA
jgi:hypothetical protein